MVSIPFDKHYNYIMNCIKYFKYSIILILIFISMNYNEFVTKF